MTNLSRILFVIDTLGSGGAQRQMCELACVLSKHGLSVSVIAYHSNNFYVPYLREHGVNVVVASCALSRLKRLIFVFKQIRISRPEVVCGFLTGPSFAVEMAKLLRVGKFRAVTSERHYDSKLTFGIFCRFVLHMASDVIIANSSCQKEFIAASAPWLKRKLFFIRNCVDTYKFSPTSNLGVFGAPIRVLVLASYTENKNVFGLLQGLRQAIDCFGEQAIVVNWYGNNGVVGADGSIRRRIYDAAITMRDELGLTGIVGLHDEVKEVEFLYRNSDVVCLPSLSEATPNVICEAMASGLPIIASRVGDIESMVYSDVGGFLFDPTNFVSIATAFQKFVELAPEARLEMGRFNRNRALELFGVESFAESYRLAFSLGK